MCVTRDTPMGKLLLGCFSTYTRFTHPTRSNLSRKLTWSACSWAVAGSWGTQRNPHWHQENTWTAQHWLAVSKSAPALRYSNCDCTLSFNCLSTGKEGGLEGIYCCWICHKCFIYGWKHWLTAACQRLHGSLNLLKVVASSSLYLAAETKYHLVAVKINLCHSFSRKYLRI